MPKIKVLTSKGDPIGPDDSNSGENIIGLKFLCAWTADNGSSPAIPFPSNLTMNIIYKGVTNGPWSIVPVGRTSELGICTAPNNNTFQGGEMVTYTFSDGSTTDPSSDFRLP